MRWIRCRCGCARCVGIRRSRSKPQRVFRPTHNSGTRGLRPGIFDAMPGGAGRVARPWWAGPTLFGAGLANHSRKRGIAIPRGSQLCVAGRREASLKAMVGRGPPCAARATAISRPIDRYRSRRPCLARPGLARRGRPRCLTHHPSLGGPWRTMAGTLASLFDPCTIARPDAARPRRPRTLTPQHARRTFEGAQR